MPAPIRWLALSVSSLSTGIFDFPLSDNPSAHFLLLWLGFASFPVKCAVFAALACGWRDVLPRTMPAAHDPGPRFSGRKQAACPRLHLSRSHRLRLRSGLNLHPKSASLRLGQRLPQRLVLLITAAQGLRLPCLACGCREPSAAVIFVVVPLPRDIKKRLFSGFFLILLILSRFKNWWAICA